MLGEWYSLSFALQAINSWKMGDLFGLRALQ